MIVKKNGGGTPRHLGNVTARGDLPGKELRRRDPVKKRQRGEFWEGVPGVNTIDAGGGAYIKTKSLDKVDRGKTKINPGEKWVEQKGKKGERGIIRSSREGEGKWKNGPR